MKHGKYYTVKRLRLLEHLLSKGFKPIKDIPDPNNWKYKNWIFENDAFLEETISSYFNNLKNKSA